MRFDSQGFMIARALFWGLVLGGGLGFSAAAQTREAGPRVSEILKVCASCHGRDALRRISSRPNIAGQKSAYIVSQLRAFRRTAAQRTKGGAARAVARSNPARSNPAMDHVIKGLDDDLVVRLAAAISMQPCNDRHTPRLLPLLPSVGQQCLACHGVNGIGKQPTIPNLAGQNRAYLRRQLLLLRESAWLTKPLPGGVWRQHPVMENQAARLSIADLDALASYFSALDCRGFPPLKSQIK